MRTAGQVCQLLEFAVRKIRRKSKTKRKSSSMNTPSSQFAVCETPADDEYEGNCDNHRRGPIADARIDGRGASRRQIGVEHAFNAEAEPRDNSSQRIDHRRDAGVCGAHKGQALLDGAHPRLLKMLIGTG